MVALAVLRDADEDVVALDQDRELEEPAAGRVEARTCGEVELPVVTAAEQQALVGVPLPVGEQDLLVRAHALVGPDAASVEEVDEHDGLALHLDVEEVALPEVVGRGGRDPADVVAHA